MDSFDPKRLSLSRATVNTAPKKQAPPHHRLGERFLKGPIPWNWLKVATALPGQALQVAMALWFLVGMKKVATVALSGAVLRDLGVSRYAGYRGLTALEGAGLVSVERHAGRHPIVTILPAPDTRED